MDPRVGSGRVTISPDCGGSGRVSTSESDPWTTLLYISRGLYERAGTVNCELWNVIAVAINTKIHVFIMGAEQLSLQNKLRQ